VFKSKKHLMIVVLIGLLLFPVGLSILAAEPTTLGWTNISNGYGISQGESYQVAGTAGEIDAGAAMSGGRFGLRGGFWTGVHDPPTPPAADKFGIFLPLTFGK